MLLQDNDTSLHNAAEKGHLPVVLALLERGADVNAQGRVRHQTPCNGLSAVHFLRILVALLFSGGWPSTPSFRQKHDVGFVNGNRAPPCLGPNLL